MILLARLRPASRYLLARIARWLTLASGAQTGQIGLPLSACLCVTTLVNSRCLVRQEFNNFNYLGLAECSPALGTITEQSYELQLALGRPPARS